MAGGNNGLKHTSVNVLLPTIDAKTPIAFGKGSRAKKKKN